MSETQPPFNPSAKLRVNPEQSRGIKAGDIIEAEVYKITNFGAFVKLPNDKRGLIHISQISDDFVKNISEHLKIGDRVKAKILAIDNGEKIELTLKKTKEYISRYPKNKGFKSSNFEEKLKVFLKRE